MVNINNLSATVLLLKGALFPDNRGDSSFPHPENGVRTDIPPAQFAAALADVNRLVRPDGTLEIHFDGVLFPAGPALLYRLKSAGFSGCRVVVTPEGILLTGRR